MVYLDDDNKAGNVTVELDRNDYDQALRAHEYGWYVEARGKIKGKRNRKMKCDVFSVLE